MTREAELNRLAHLAGYADALMQHGAEIGLIAIAIEQLHEEGDDLMSVGTVLREEAEAVRTSATAVEASIQEALGRLSDNATAEDIAAARASLQGASEANARSLAAAANIDPADTSGGVVDDGSGGVVEGGGGEPPVA